MQIMTLELSENPFFFGHKSDLERKCRILLLIRDQVTLVKGEGRGERKFNHVGIGRGISGRQKSIKKGIIENSPGVIR